MSKKQFTRGVPSDNWSNPYNEFNSFKYLMWREYIESIIKGEFKPPFMVDIDPSNVCNFNCIWCNSREYRKSEKCSVGGDGIGFSMMPSGHLFKLADFLKEWGVKSACVSGGGEPMNHPEYAPFLWHMKDLGLKTGIICNGSMMDTEKGLATVECSSWCGFSIDAHNPSTFAKVHGTNEEMYFKVIDNLITLVRLKEENNSSIEITYKYLLHPENYDEILPAVEHARDIGCNTFHLRPVCVDNLYGQTKPQITYSKKQLESINQQIEHAKELENNEFKFYGIRHKFNPDFTRKINFSRCWATPMMATFGADGNVHLCFDVRGKEDWILCKHYPNVDDIVNVWGGPKHKRIIETIDPNKCPRCTFGTLNEIFEEVFIHDKMYKDFL